MAVEVPSSGPYPHLLVEAYCCRMWEVDPREHIRRCGYCGEVPVLLDETEQ